MRSLRTDRIISIFGYPAFVVVLAIISSFVLGPGSTITLVLLMGIITIPLAIAFGLIPAAGLTLALSLPIYAILLNIYPGKILKSIFGSIFVAVLVSAGTCLAVKLYLTERGLALSGADIDQSVDFFGKTVALLNSKNPEICGEFCKSLIVVGGASEVVVIDVPFNNELPDSYEGTSFKLTPTQTKACEPGRSRGLVGELISSLADKGHCINKTFDNAGQPDLVVIASDVVKSGKKYRYTGFNPFINAIYAQRTHVYDLSNDEAIKILQYTAVEIYPPTPVLIPYSIAKGPHTSAEKSLHRSTIELKQQLNVQQLLFNADQISAAQRKLSDKQG